MARFELRLIAQVEAPRGRQPAAQAGKLVSDLLLAGWTVEQFDFGPGGRGVPVVADYEAGVTAMGRGADAEAQDYDAYARPGAPPQEEEGL